MGFWGDIYGDMKITIIECQSLVEVERVLAGLGFTGGKNLVKDGNLEEVKKSGKSIRSRIAEQVCEAFGPLDEFPNTPTKITPSFSKS